MLTKFVCWNMFGYYKRQLEDISSLSSECVNGEKERESVCQYVWNGILADCILNLNTMQNVETKHSKVWG